MHEGQPKQSYGERFDQLKADWEEFGVVNEERARQLRKELISLRGTLVFMGGSVEGLDESMDFLEFIAGDQENIVLADN